MDVFIYWIDDNDIKWKVYGEMSEYVKPTFHSPAEGGTVEDPRFLNIASKEVLTEEQFRELYSDDVVDEVLAELNSQNPDEPYEEDIDEW